MEGTMTARDRGAKDAADNFAKVLSSGVGPVFYECWNKIETPETGEVSLEWKRDYRDAFEVEACSLLGRWLLG
jgi:hypothetical protein